MANSEKPADGRDVRLLAAPERSVALAALALGDLFATLGESPERHAEREAEDGVRAGRAADHPPRWCASASRGRGRPRRRPSSASRVQEAFEVHELLRAVHDLLPPTVIRSAPDLVENHGDVVVAVMVVAVRDIRLERIEVRHLGDQRPMP